MSIGAACRFIAITATLFLSAAVTAGVVMTFIVLVI
jgi:hypothetical protein